MLDLASETSDAWVRAAVADLDTILLDHAHCEKKRSEEHTSELQSQFHLVCRLLLEKKNTPESGSCSPERILMNVDLPAPLRPTSAWISPGSRVRSRPARARVAPKSFTTPTSMTNALINASPALRRL